MLEQLEIRKQKWKDEGKTDKEISFEAANWKLLEGLRYVKSNSFDFVLQSVGIYENSEILAKAASVLIEKFQNMRTAIENDELIVKPAETTLPNCYDITLENEDYTIGNILNNEIYDVAYTTLKVLDYVGFKKMHPHDSDSVLRISLIDVNKGVSDIKMLFKAITSSAIAKLQTFKGHFKK